jgi:hypothetical protein
MGLGEEMIFSPALGRLGHTCLTLRQCVDDRCFLLFLLFEVVPALWILNGSCDGTFRLVNFLALACIAPSPVMYPIRSGANSLVQQRASKATVVPHQHQSIRLHNRN